MNGLRAVIFDLDGTLAETQHMAIELIAEAIVVGGGPHLEDHEVVAMFGRNEQGLFRDAVGETWEKAWDFYLDEYETRHEEAAEPFPGVVELVRELQEAGSRLGVITAKTLITGTLSLRAIGLETYFEEVRGGGPDSVTKCEQITELVELWGLEPQSVVYVGDTATDMAEARKAGVVPAAACWSVFVDRESMEASRPEVMFDSVEDLRGWMFADV